MKYNDLERINQSKECCYHKIRIQKYDEVLNNYLLSDDNENVIFFDEKGPQHSKYHMMVITLQELINLIIYRDEFVYITNLEVLRGEDDLLDYNVQRQLHFSFVNKTDYYVNNAKDIDESFYHSKMYMKVLQNSSGVMVDKKIKVADISDVLYSAENGGYNAVTCIIDKVNEKLERYFYPKLSDVEEHMLKNIVRDELADRIMM